MADDFIYHRKLKNLCQKLVWVKDNADSKTVFYSNQGQSLDGFSELQTYRSIIEEISATLFPTPDPEPSHEEES